MLSNCQQSALLAIATTAPQTDRSSPKLLMQVLPPGENKTQKVAVGDLSGVVQCFSVKKGEVTLSFKTLPCQDKVACEALPMPLKQLVCHVPTRCSSCSSNACQHHLRSWATATPVLCIVAMCSLRSKQREHPTV